MENYIMNNAEAIQEHKKNDFILSLRGANVDDVLNKLREILIEKEKNIPSGIPHTIWLTGIHLQWDYFH